MNCFFLTALSVKPGFQPNHCFIEKLQPLQQFRGVSDFLKYVITTALKSVGFFVTRPCYVKLLDYSLRRPGCKILVHQKHSVQQWTKHPGFLFPIENSNAALMHRYLEKIDRSL